MRIVLLTLAVVVAAVSLTACGSGSKSSAISPASSASDASGGKVTVRASEFAFAPAKLDVKAGKLVVTLDNQGKAPHEFILLKTDQAPDALQVTGERVSETASVGEVPETPGGKSASATFDLKPGRYVYVCNIPGHYQDGMRGELTVR